MTIRAITIDAAVPGPVEADQLAAIIADTLADARACWLPLPQHVTARTIDATAELEFDGHDAEQAWKAVNTWCRRHKAHPHASLKITPEHGRHTRLKARFDHKGVRFTVCSRITHDPASLPEAARQALTPGSGHDDPHHTDGHPADGNPSIVIRE
jgi:hypothetical protein